MSANIKLITAEVPGVGECIGLVTTAPELFLTTDNVLDLVDALLNLREVVTERNEKTKELKRPALRVVGGKNAVH